MSEQPSLFCFYSDDIRHEVNGKTSLIGAYGAEMYLDPIPTHLPRLVISAYIRVPSDLKSESLSVQIRFNDQVLQEVTPSVDAIRDHADKLGHDAQEVTFGLAFVLQPFQVPEEGTLEVMAQLNGFELAGNRLRIKRTTAHLKSAH